MPWTDASSGSASWDQVETHPYALITEDGAYFLMTEDERNYIGISNYDGAFWGGVSSGTATWSAA